MRKLWIVLALVLAIGILPVAAEELSAYASVEQDLAKLLFDAFEQDTKIKVNFVRLGSGELEARIEAEKSAPQASIWVGGVGINHISAKRKGLTVPYKSKAAETVPAQYKDPEAYWVGLYLGPLTFTTNLDRAKELGLKPPTSWDDLIQPEYKNRFRVAFPGSSGTGYNVITTIIYLKGMNEDKAFDYLRKFGANCEKFERSGPAPSRSVAIGEIPVAVGYAHDSVRMKAQGANVVITLPKEGTGYELATMSLIKGGKQPVAAKKLYDWVLGPKGQQIIADFFVVPVSSLAKPHPMAFKMAEIKTVKQDFDWDAANKARLQDRFTREIGNK